MLDLRKKHAVECNLDIIRTIGIDNKNPKLEYTISPKDKFKANGILRMKNIKKYFIVHPGFSYSSHTKYPSRLWPPERYAEVIDKITEKYTMKAVITGNEEEKTFARQILRLVKNKKSLVILNGETTTNELAAIIQKSQAIVAPSTGVIHLASALGTKIVQLSGKDKPFDWRPWTDEKKYRLLFHPEVCTECDKNYCRKKTIECMNSITSEEVINALDSLLKV
jgi:ADP-heptose:LPS heptosyltransferase